MMIKTILDSLKILVKYGSRAFKRRAMHKLGTRALKIKELKNIHVISEFELDKQRKCVFKDSKLFSIITPLYNTPENYLLELLESLQAQTYDNWELCLADGSDAEHAYVEEICKQWSKADSRFKYRRLKENRGISGNTNECLELATGDYIGLLDHDDLLHPAALYEVMRTIEREQADFLYTDEVKFEGDVNGIVDPNRFNFKPGFNKYELRSHNYICHFTVFKKDLLKDEKEMYRSEYDGSQDHDMVLRLTEKAEKVVHIPKVLYYWRVHKNSVAQDVSAKPYVVDAALRAVSSQLERQNELGKVTSNLPFQTIYKVQYVFSQELVSIVIHGTSDAGKIKKSIQSVLEHTKYRNIEFVYNSKKELKLDVQGFRIVNAGATLRRSKSDLWNNSIKKAVGKYVILLDYRCAPSENRWVEEMLMLCQKKDVCIVAPAIFYRDGTVAYAGISLRENAANGVKYLCSNNLRDEIGYEAILCYVRKTMAASAACMMFSKKEWETLRGFQNCYPGYEDIEFCIRAQKTGKSVIWTPFAKWIFTGSEFPKVQNGKTKETFCQDYQRWYEMDDTYQDNWEKLKLV